MRAEPPRVFDPAAARCKNRSARLAESFGAGELETFAALYTLPVSPHWLTDRDDHQCETASACASSLYGCAYPVRGYEPDNDKKNHSQALHRFVLCEHPRDTSG